MKHRNSTDIAAALPHIQAAPDNNGSLEMIVTRPQEGARRQLGDCVLSEAAGAHGDRWAREATPGRQICLMNARCIDFIAGTRDRWPLAGNTLFVDLDLSAGNLPPGQRLAIGTAEIEITDTPHAAGARFATHFGTDAHDFVNSPDGTTHRLRGVFARVTRDGRVATGDRVRKFP